MSEHTKGTWRYKQRGQAGLVDVFIGDHLNGRIDLIAEVITAANARRIVACVNLLEGHDTERIEGKTLEQYVSEQAFINGMTVQEGFNIELNGLACQMMASAFAGQFKGSGAINYLEVSGNHPEIGGFTVTIQRDEGKTPHQFRIAAEQQRDELLEALKRIAAIENSMYGQDWDEIDKARRIANAAIEKVKK